jgi:hypothetical protein
MLHAKFATRTFSPFLVANLIAMFLVDRLDGIFHMRLRTEPSIFNFAMCIAAFSVVALVVVFAHPASPTSRVAAANAAAGSEVAAADQSLKPAPTPRQDAKRQGSQP